MKIILVGVLDIPWSTNISMKNALEKAGHTVEPFNYRSIESQRRKTCFLSDTAVNKVIEKGCSLLRSNRTTIENVLVL